MSCDFPSETLSLYEAGELETERIGAVEAHLERCETCRGRLKALRDVDALLRVMPKERPSARAVLETRRGLSRTIRGAREPEILTLEEVAEFLRISMEELQEVIEELPAFELAGQIRVRRTKLMEWIEKRERAHLRGAIESEVSQILAGF